MGRQATVSIPFGDSALTLVMSPQRPLTGSLAENLAWIVAGVGGAMSLTGAGLTERLVRQRRRAEALAETNAALYAEQRGVAKTLQQALLPEVLPQLAGAVVAARYIAGVDGIDIGGDWYELIPVEDDRVILVVGDVSGRGLRAATTMAELRYATRALSLDSSSPADIVSKLSRLVNIESGGEFATMLCALVDIGAHEVTLTNAGHPPPLIVEGHGTRFVAGAVQVPIGVAGPHTYTSTKIKVQPNATLLAFTDGLIERRGEPLEVGLQRLSDIVLATDGTLDDVLTVLASGLGGAKSDDTAILGLRWNG
jgi:serine phosphatase RsbU (regulator of sigma subunit)